jgi:hypothetical protein
MQQGLRAAMGCPNFSGALFMQDKHIHTRRSMVKLGISALAMIPIVAMATKNDAMRAGTKYQDHPEGDKQCSLCAQFIPGKGPKDPGGCKIFPGDTEVSPTGYCITWSKKA